jgi:hypothetical protein
MKEKDRIGRGEGKRTDEEKRRNEEGYSRTCRTGIMWREKINVEENWRRK